MENILVSIEEHKRERESRKEEEEGKDEFIFM